MIQDEALEALLSHNSNSSSNNSPFQPKHPTHPTHPTHNKQPAQRYAPPALNQIRPFKQPANVTPRASAPLFGTPKTPGGTRFERIVVDGYLFGI